LSKKCKELPKNAQFLQKSARFLQKNCKKLQKIPIFLPHSRPKPTHLRQITKPNKKASSALGTERRPAEEAQANVLGSLCVFCISYIYRCARQAIRYTFSEIFRKKIQNHHNSAKNSQKNNAGGF